MLVQPQHARILWGSGGGLAELHLGKGAQIIVYRRHVGEPSFDLEKDTYITVYKRHVPLDPV